MMKVMFSGISMCFFILERKKRGMKLIIMISVEFKIGIWIFLEVLNIIWMIERCLFFGRRWFLCRCLYMFFILIMVLFISELMVMVIFFRFMVLIVSFMKCRVRMDISSESGRVISEIIVVCMLVRNRNKMMIIKILFLKRDFFILLMELLMKWFWWKILVDIFIFGGRFFWRFCNEVFSLLVNFRVLVVGCLVMVISMVGFFFFEVVFSLGVFGLIWILVIFFSSIGMLLIFFIIVLFSCFMFVVESILCIMYLLLYL